MAPTSTSFQQILDKKIASVRAFKMVPDSAVDRFAGVIAEAGDWELYRINPLSFAARHRMEVRHCIDLFVAGARVGLFDFEWSLLCPACGGVQQGGDSLDHFSGEDCYCELCEVNVEANLDDQVEVSFTLNPGVRELRLEPFADVQSYLRYHFSANYEKPPQVQEYVASCLREFVVLERNGFTQVALRLSAGQDDYRIISLDSHRTCWVRVTPGAEAAAPQFVDLELGSEGFPKELHLSPGPVTLQLRNALGAKAAVMLWQIDLQRIYTLMGQYPRTVHPFLSGKMLLNQQSFRELFKVQCSNPSLRLAVKSLTILFSDLRESTAMYDRIGDLAAYQLIQSHFSVLSKAVHNHSGAIIKTMGDAIMATFSTPRDAVLAATEMVRELENLNASLEASDQKLALKLGLHEGPALAVNSNDRVDYFGQTVNIASRVQGLAGSGELLLTDAVQHAWGVADVLDSTAKLKEAAPAVLRGVTETTTVHRYEIAKT